MIDVAVLIFVCAVGTSGVSVRMDVEVLSLLLTIRKFHRKQAYSRIHIK